MKKLVIFTFGGGRTCNQMLNCVHLLSVRYATDGELDIQNLPAQEFEELYPGLVRELSAKKVRPLRLVVRVALFVSGFHPRLRRKLLECWLPSALHLIMPAFGVRWIGVVNDQSKWIRGHRLGSTSLFHLLTDRRLDGCQRIALGGWGVRDWPLALQYREKIGNLIRENNPHYFAATRYLKSRRRQGAQLIGVLIRQTDYRRWQQGEYFYETKEYVEFMNKIAQAGDSQFLVASDESQNMQAFLGLDVILASGREIGSGHYMESFFELALCDKILSPPSSFALMAAYVGSGTLLKLPGRQNLCAEMPIKEMPIDASWHDEDFSKVS
jgi:hypothetical protein